MFKRDVGRDWSLVCQMGMTLREAGHLAEGTTMSIDDETSLQHIKPGARAKLFRVLLGGPD